MVTGGSSDIGLAVAKRFAVEGADVFVSDRISREDLDQLFETVKVSAGKLDIVVTSSDVSEYSTIDEIKDEHFDQAFDLNVSGVVFAFQRAISLMPPGSAILLIGSIADFVGTPDYGTYEARKGSVLVYARTWTNELAGRVIRVNTLSPGPTNTAMFAEASDEVRRTLTEQIPLQPWVSPKRSRRLRCTCRPTKAVSLPALNYASTAA